MKLVIGLGNPGENYKNNRHNVGQMVVAKLKIQSTRLKDVVIAQTNTFMNDSGKFIESLVNNYHVAASDLFIIHDDLDIVFGSYKIQLGKGPKDHKGLESIDQALGTSEYWHVRVGVDNRDPENRTLGEEYVLQDFTKEEFLKVDGVVGEAVRDLCKKLATS